MAATPKKIATDPKKGLWSAWYTTALAYTALLLLLLYPLLTHGVSPMWDAFDLGYPDFTYLADAIRSGRFPLWDPYTNCGLPMHANPGGMTLNPVAILFGVLFDSTALGFLWFWVFYWWLGGFGMLWLARHYGAAPLGALVATITYTLSGFFVAHAEHTSFIIVAGCLPWIILCAERAVIFSSIAYALLAGAALGFCSYTGYAGLTLFSCFAIAFWLLLRFLPPGVLPEGEPRSLSKRLLWIAITLAVMAIILVMVWLPSLHAFLVDGRGYTDRVDQLDVVRATQNEAFTFQALLSLFFPYATFTGRGWMGCDISMSNAYLGILTIPLALCWGWRTGLRRSWWLFLFVAFMFIVSLGGKYGLRTLLYYLYSPSRYMQFNAPFRLYWIFPLCLAAGLGLTRWLSHSEDRRGLLRIVFGWALVTGAAAFALVLLSRAYGTPVTDAGYRLFAPATVVLLLGGACLWFGRRAVTSQTVGLVALALTALMLVDMSIHLYNNSGTVWNPEPVTREVEKFHQRSTVLNGPPAPRTPGMPYGYFNAHMVLKQPLVQGYVTMKSERFERLCKSRFVEVLSSPYRFWLSPGVEPVSLPDSVLLTLSNTGGESPVPVFVEQTVGLPPLRTVPGQYGTVEIKRYAPELIEMRVGVPGTTGAFLASTERYTPGWKALVDGVPQPVQRVNLFFRGIYVPAGEHAVTWKYQPDWWVPLVWLSYLTCGGTALAGGWLLLRHRRARRSAMLPSTPAA